MVSLCFSKHVYYAETSLDFDDGLDLQPWVPFRM